MLPMTSESSTINFDKVFSLSYDIIHPWHRENVIKYFKNKNDLDHYITKNNLDKVIYSLDKSIYPMNKLQISEVTLLKHGNDYYNIGSPIKLE